MATPKNPKPEEAPGGASAARKKVKRKDAAEQKRLEHLARQYEPIDNADWTALQRRIQEAQDHPDEIAARLIEGALQAVHLDPRVHADAPELARLVTVMRQALWNHVPGMTLEEMTTTLVTFLSNHGGGKPPKAAEEDAWLSDFERRKASDRMKKSAPEIYEDMAAEETHRRAKTGGRSVKWTRIRDGISAARKRRKNGV